MSPEAINPKNSTVSGKSDIWGTAALVVEMLTEKPPYADIEPVAALFKIGQPETNFDEIIPRGCSQRVKALLQRCFKRDPSRRPTAEQLLEDPYLL